MSFEFGALDAALTAAVGDDPSMISELRSAFLDSAYRQVDLLQRARCDANWQFAAWRLKGLAASFGVVSVLTLADEAAISVPSDPVILKKLKTALAAIEEFRD